MSGGDSDPEEYECACLSFAEDSASRAGGWAGKGSGAGAGAWEPRGCGEVIAATVPGDVEEAFFGTLAALPGVARASGWGLRL